LTDSVLHFLVPCIPPRSHCTDRHQQHFSIDHWPTCSPNQSGNIWWNTPILPLWGFWILDAIGYLSDAHNVRLPVIFTVICIIPDPIPVKPIFGVQRLSAIQSSSLLAEWQSILLIQQTFNTRVSPAGRSFADNVIGRSEFSDDVNTAAPSFWMFHLDASTFSSAFEIYPTAVIWMFWAQDYFCVACRFWLCWFISTKSCILAVLCNYFLSASLVISMLLPVFIMPNARSSPANNILLTWPNCLTTTFWWKVLPVTFDCLQLITFRRMENWPPLPHHLVW